MEKIIESIYSYTDNRGMKLWTPNGALAHARAEHFGTDEVYEYTYEVIIEPKENGSNK